MGRPELVAMDGECVEALSSSAPASGSDSAAGQLDPETAPGEPPARRNAPILLWSLGAALAVMAVLFAAQVQRAGQLTAENHALREELGSAQARLSAWESHMSDVRGEVQGLSAQVAALEGLVNRDPQARQIASGD